MDFALAILVLAIALVVLAYPLYRARQQPGALNISALDNVLAERDGVYASLRDLEMDKQLGKLDDADYNARREQYMAQAAVILQELDTLQGQGSAQAASDAIEKQVAALRKEKSNGQAPSAAGGQSSRMHCTNCGRAYDKGDKFCAKCGHALN